MFLFILSILHDFHDIHNNSLFDQNNDIYYQYLRTSLEDHFEKEAKVISASKNVKNLILLQLESWAYDTIMKPNLCPNLKKFFEQYELIYPIYIEKYSGHSLAGISVTQTGIPMIYPDIIWEEIVREYNFLNGFKGISNILHSFNFDTEYASTGDLSIMGIRSWILDHKYHQIYQGKNDNYLFQFFIKEYLKKLDDRARNSQFQNHTLTYIVNCNTHTPYDRPLWCRLPYPDNIKPYEKCFHCVDDLVGKFIQKYLDLKMYEHTLLVAFPDHQPYHLSEKGLYILFPGMNKTDLKTLKMKNKFDYSYYDLAPTVLNLIGINEYSPEFIYGRNIYDSSSEMKKICINETCFFKHRRPDVNDLSIIYKFLHFEKGKNIKKSYSNDKKFRCNKKDSNGNVTFYDSDKPCF